jgi:hypothetical protein
MNEHEHRWERPFSILSGSPDVPGVFSHSRGGVSHSICSICGAERVYSWEMRPRRPMWREVRIYALEDQPPDRAEQIRAWLMERGSGARKQGR